MCSLACLQRVFDCLQVAPRSSDSITDETPTVDDDGHLCFSKDDENNPKSWSFSLKCYLSAVMMVLVINATFSSSAPTGAIDGISKDFQVSSEAAGLVTTLFLLGYCAGPLLWAPLSEFYGRRWPLYLAFSIYVVFNFLCAFAPNFAALLIGRFTTGVGASAILSNGPGLIADIWGPAGRGNTMAVFMVATFCGPALGPIVAGFLQLDETWRWTFYALLWLAAPTFVLMLTLPETLAGVILARKQERLRGQGLLRNSVQPPRRQSLGSIFKTSLARPWLILFDPISFCIAVYYCVVYTLLYMLFGIYPIVFQQKRGWNAGVGELPLLGTVVGACLGGCILLFISMREQKTMQGGGKMVPEDRLPAAMAGAVLFAVSMFWFAWTAEYNSIPWIVPTLAGTMLAAAILLIFAAFINYLVDTYLMYAASAVAANTVVRSACAATSPLFTQYMFDILGVGGGGSLIGGVAILLMPIPFVFHRYGPAIRARSKYAQTDKS